jgi:hypothetical protein
MTRVVPLLASILWSAYREEENRLTGDGIFAKSIAPLTVTVTLFSRI